MSVIEGIGDEVLQFFSVVLVVTLGVAAWWSTSIRDSHHNIRTVLILERRSRNRNNDTQPAALLAETDNAIDTGQQEETDAVQTELLTEDSQDKDESESSTEAGAVATSAETQADSAKRSSETSDLEESTGNQIRIRLKYLNDDQKLVEGRLHEPLGEFKRRHFNLELAADKLVRLIFNGQVLGSDQQTLAACGLFDNCVVHCLVHNQRAPPRASGPVQSNPTSQPSHGHASPPTPDWNLSTLLYACLSLVLCLVWYCRYQYAQLFTLTTTVALFGLTGIFSVSIFSLYLPNQDGIPH